MKISRQAGRQAGRQAMKAPPAMREAIATLRSERARVGAELDTIDLALTNLCRLYELDAVPVPERPVHSRRTYTRRQKPGRKPKRQAAASPTAAVTEDAAERRQQLLTLIGKSEVGLTIADLRKLTPKMDPKDRSNALSILKARGGIRRAGNTWVKA